MNRILYNIKTGLQTSWTAMLAVGIVGLSMLLFSGQVGAEELRDVRPPLDDPEFPWMWVVLAIVIMALLARIGILWMKRRNLPKAPPEPWEVAMRSLESLRTTDLPGQGRYKEFYTELSSITRDYIERRFDIRASEMTTEEFLGRMRTSDLLMDNQKDILAGLLRTADMVKFARYMPDAAEIASGLDDVDRFVKETRLNASTNAPNGAGS